MSKKRQCKNKKNSINDRRECAGSTEAHTKHQKNMKVTMVLKKDNREAAKESPRKSHRLENKAMKV